MCRNRRSSMGRRQGVVVLEMLLAAIMLMAVVVAVVQYVAVVVTQSTMTHAATVGAREAGKMPEIGPDISDVVEAVNKVLAANSIVISSTAGSGTKVVVEKGADVYAFGDPTLDCDPPTSPTPAASEVRVTLCVLFSAKKTDGTTPVLRPLNAFGFMVHGTGFQVSSLAIQE